MHRPSPSSPRSASSQSSLPGGESDASRVEERSGQDTVWVKDLHLRGIIGINDWEREKIQDIVINIWMTADLRAAGVSDSIEDCVNYRTVTKRVIAHVESSERLTVEALAADIAKIACGLRGVEAARVRVEKPGAVRFAASVGVEIERRPADFGLPTETMGTAE